MTTGERLRQILEVKGITQYKLAKAIGAPLTTVNGWFKRGNEPRDTYMQKTAAFLGISPAYLRYGVDEEEREVPAESVGIIPVITNITDGFPHFIGKWNSSLRLPGISGDCFAINQPDDSMAPFIKKGDVVIFRPYTDDVTLEQGDYVIMRDKLDMPIVRRWGVNSQTKLEILISDNPEYQQIEYKDEWSDNKPAIKGVVIQVWERKYKRGSTIS